MVEDKTSKSRHVPGSSGRINKKQYKKDPSRKDRRTFLKDVGKGIGCAGIGAAGLSSLSASDLDAILSGLGWGDGGGRDGIFGINIFGGKKHACPLGCLFSAGGQCGNQSGFTCRDFVCEGGGRGSKDFTCTVNGGFTCETFYWCVQQFDVPEDCPEFHCNGTRIEGYFRKPW